MKAQITINYVFKMSDQGLANLHMDPFLAFMHYHNVLSFLTTFKLQWLEHLWDHGNLFDMGSWRYELFEG